MSKIELSTYTGEETNEAQPKVLTKGQEMPMVIGDNSVLFKYGEDGVVRVFKQNGMPFDGLPSFSQNSLVVFPSGKAIQIKVVDEK